MCFLLKVAEVDKQPNARSSYNAKKRFQRRCDSCLTKEGTVLPAQLEKLSGPSPSSHAAVLLGADGKSWSAGLSSNCMALQKHIRDRRG